MYRQIVIFKVDTGERRRDRDTTAEEVWWYLMPDIGVSGQQSVNVW